MRRSSNIADLVFRSSSLARNKASSVDTAFGATSIIDWGKFGAIFFMITGFHGTHVTIGVIFLFIMTRKVFRGDFDTGRRGFFTSQKSHYEAIEIMGLYWHFVDLVWVFIFAFFYLW